MLADLSFLAVHQNFSKGCHHKLTAKLFHVFYIESAFSVSAVKHPHQRTIRKLRHYKCLHEHSQSIQILQIKPVIFYQLSYRLGQPQRYFSQFALYWVLISQSDQQVGRIQYALKRRICICVSLRIERNLSKKSFFWSKHKKIRNGDLLDCFKQFL